MAGSASVSAGSAFKPKNDARFPFGYVHPHAGIDTSYNDNVYLINKPTGDLVTVVKPGVAILIGKKVLSEEGAIRGYLEVDPGYTINQYFWEGLRRDEPNIKVQGQLVRGRFALKFSHLSEETNTQTSALTPGHEGIIEYYRHLTDVGLAFTRGRFAAELGYDRIEYIYDRPFKESGNIEHKVSLTGLATPSFAPKTQFLVEYDYGQLEYPKQFINGSDYLYHQFWIGARNKITRKISGSIKFGYELRANYAHLNKYKDSLTARINLTYRHTPKFAVVLGASREARPSTSIGVGLEEGYKFSLHTVYDFTTQLKFDTGIDYAKSIYTTTFEDDLYGYSARLDYKVNKYSTVGVEYKYRQRVSDRADSKYSNNILTTRMGLIF